jgi:CDP-diacylglycerol--glycerol-3-phosphate 3-phosphatidyltransferase
LVHLGCARNLIDSELMLGRLAEEGLIVTDDPGQAHTVVLNTCSFIGPAREESYGAIRSLLERKRRGEIQAVVVAGCLVQRYKRELSARFPQVDVFAEISDYRELARTVRGLTEGRSFARYLEGPGLRAPERDGARLLATPGSYAYLRISHGCDHTCSFCAIPSIRGPHRSKRPSVVLEEARELIDAGVRELVLVAEDSTAWGRDFGMELPQLVEALAELDGEHRLRVMYAYPNRFPWDLTRLLREHPRVVPYLDIPVHHVATSVLRAMRRAGSGDQVRAILDRLLEEVPGLTLRTTLLVGFPGETGTSSSSSSSSLPAGAHGCLLLSRRRTSAHGRKWRQRAGTPMPPSPPRGARRSRIAKAPSGGSSWSSWTVPCIRGARRARGDGRAGGRLLARVEGARERRGPDSRACQALDAEACCGPLVRLSTMGCSSTGPTASRACASSALRLCSFSSPCGASVRPDVEHIRPVLQIAFWLFALTAASDFLDGFLARRNHLVTAFGRIADPFVDKVLIVGAMVFLTVLPWSRPWLPAWVVVVIVAREFLVTAIRGYIESIGRPFPADRFGKLKMVMQCLAVGDLMWMWAFDWSPAWFRFWSVLATVLVWGMLLSTVGSGLSYLAKTRRLLGEPYA